jgi:predicted oxidoreductase
MDADVIIVGAGLSGLVAARETHRAGLRTVIIDQEGPQDLGGQAWWSFGGLFLVDSPEQRRLRVRDSFELAWQDWRGSARWDRLDGEHPDDGWAERWGRAYVEFAAGEKRAWIREAGIELTPVVGWAERGDLTAGGHGNSVPRFHVPWGTGTSPPRRTPPPTDARGSCTGIAATGSWWRTGVSWGCAAASSEMTRTRGAPSPHGRPSATSSCARER